LAAPGARVKRPAPGAPTTAITIAVPASVQAVAALQLEAETERDFALSCTIDTPEDYAIVCHLLTEICKREDAAIAMRKSATGPMYQSVRTIESWFKDLLGACAAARAHLKKEVARYEIARKNSELEARRLAAKAAETGDAGTLITALTTAADAAERVPGGTARIAFGYVVKRIAADMLPDEWWCPDVARIEAVAKAHKGDEPPVIPGVVFERVALVGAKRK
jgi:hypothetical protein